MRVLSRELAHQSRTNEARPAGDQNLSAVHGHTDKTTGAPRFFSEAVAASAKATTRRPAIPSVIGVALADTHVTNWFAILRSASVASICGACMSPLRYPTSI